MARLAGAIPTFFWSNLINLESKKALRWLSISHAAFEDFKSVKQINSKLADVATA